MDKPRTSYETMFIVDASKGIDAAKELIGKFTDLIAANATVTKVVDLGIKQLAYEINDMKEGYYTIVYFEAAQSFPAELSRVFNITDGVMRSLIIANSVAPEDVVIDTPAPAEDDAEATEVEEALAEEVADSEAESEPETETTDEAEEVPAEETAEPEAE